MLSGRLAFGVWRLNLFRLLDFTINILGSHLVAEVIVALVQLLTLLLQGLQVRLFLGQLLLQLSHLGRLALLVALVALKRPNLVLEMHVVEEDVVHAVQDERQEEGEAAEVHVALGVELAGLDLEAFVAEYGRSLGGMLSRSDNFQLNAIYAVHAVNKEDQDEDEGDAQPVHHLGQNGVFGDEGEDLSLGCVGKRDEKEHEQPHLQDEKKEDQSVVERHGGGGEEGDSCCGRWAVVVCQRNRKKIQESRVDLVRM